jgi:outer membrane protein OmpA-like peptidoglycan-associated protein
MRNLQRANAARPTAGSFVRTPSLFHSFGQAGRGVWPPEVRAPSARRPTASAGLRVTWPAVLPLCAVVLICFAGFRHHFPAPPASASAADTLLPLPPPTADERLVHTLRRLGAVYGPRGEVLRVRGLTFEVGRSTVTPGNEGYVGGVVALLSRHPEVAIVIEGYTDNRGGRLRNILLSLKRAEAVRNLLVNRGVDPPRLLMRGMGSDDPIASNATPEGRAENRRIEIVLSDLKGRFAVGAGQESAGTPTHAAPGRCAVTSPSRASNQRIVRP